jgi:hypothetical protein
MFQFELKMPVLELGLFYLILTNLFMMITCLKSSISSSNSGKEVNNYFMDLYKSKLLSKDPSTLWLLSFNILKYANKLVFLAFFHRATMIPSEMDSAFSLTLLTIFAFYFTWESLYEKGPMIPAVIIS